tara:strand:- start:713 stop:1996 length:1284 start_codon:yes stop_codon:yes gene_type:complete
MPIKDLSKKSFSVLTIRSLGILLLFLFTLFITNFFNSEDVGRYDFARSTLNILGALALMGTNQSIIYYSGLLKARNSIESIRLIYISMLKIIFSFSIIILTCFNIMFDESSVNNFFDSKESFDIIFKCMLTLIFFTLTMLNIDTIRSLQKTILSELYRGLFRYIPVFILATILLKLNFQEYLVEAYLLGFVFLSILSSIQVFYLLSILKKPNSKSISFNVKEIFLTSAPMALSTIAYFIMQSIDVIILSIYEGFNQIAYYSVSVKLALTIALALMSVNIVIAPKVAEVFEKGHFNEMQLLIKNSTRIIVLISIIALSILILFSETILALFGPEYVTANEALLILLAAQFFNAISGPGSIYLNMSGRQRVLNKILIIGLLFNILLNFYFIPIEGITGAAKATFISVLAWKTMVAVFIYSKDKIKIFLT